MPQTATPLADSVEDPWIRRELKRLAAVAIVRESAYFMEAERRGIHIPGPNPYDRTVSKRSWERSVHEWRHALQDAILHVHGVRMTYSKSSF